MAEETRIDRFKNEFKKEDPEFNWKVRFTDFGSDTKRSRGLVILCRFKDESKYTQNRRVITFDEIELVKMEPEPFASVIKDMMKYDMLEFETRRSNNNERTCCAGCNAGDQG